MATVELPHLLSVDDVASYLGVPKGTVYAWRLRRVGPPAIKVGKHLRFRHEDLVQWLEERKTVLQSEEPGGLIAAGSTERGGGPASYASAGPSSPPAVDKSSARLSIGGNGHGSPEP